MATHDEGAARPSGADPFPAEHKTGKTMRPAQQQWLTLPGTPPAAAVEDTIEILPPSEPAPAPVADELEADIPVRPSVHAPPHLAARTSRPPTAAAPTPLPPSPTPPPFERAEPASRITTRAPNARGTLADKPLPHLLTHLVAHEITGTLVLRAEEEHALTFRSGAPERLRTNLSLAPLGAMLVKLGWVDDAEIDAAVVRATMNGESLGKQLVADGLADDDVIALAIREQMRERVAHLAGLPPSTEFAFYAGVDLLGDGRHEPVPYDGLAVIMAAVRGFRDLATMDRVIATLGDRRLVLHPAATIPRFSFTDEESSMVEVVRWSWRSYPELLEADPAMKPLLRRVTYALAITKHLDLGPDTWPIAVERPQEKAAPRFDTPWVDEVRRAEEGDGRFSFPPRPSGLPAEPRSLEAFEPKPPSPTPELEAQRQRIVETARGLAGKSHYDVLGLAPNASSIEVQHAYLQLAKTFHPDRVPEAIADARDAAAQVFARIAEAHATLTDAAKRRTYDGSLAGGGRGAEEHVERIIEASVDYQKAEILLKRGDVAGAEVLARAAVAKDPNQASYKALLGWVRAMNPGAVPLAEGIVLLDDALRNDPRSDRALYYRGVLLKRANRPVDAIRDFKKAAELNPKNLDAVREVRLHAIRAAQGQKQMKGLIRKLFDK